MRRAEGWGTASALSIHNTTDWTLLVNQGIKQFHIYYALHILEITYGNNQFSLLL